jgi:predicted permease
MRALAKLQSICRSLFRRKRAELELAAEMQDHFEREVESGIQAGLSPAQAKLAAQRVFGSVELFKEECRDARGIGFLENITRDLRYGCRVLRRTPLFCAVAIGTLGLGIGANTTLFTFVQNILLRSIPVRDPAALVAPNWGESTINISYPNYLDLRDRNTVFSNLVAYRYVAAGFSLEERDNSRVWGYQATGNYWQMLGIQPALGRFFGPADDKQGGQPVVVISHRLWQTRFAADPNIAGRAIKINGFPFTIIGVAPAFFGGTEFIVSADYWVPLAMQPQLEPGFPFMTWRTSQNLWILGRLKPGVTAAGAEANLNQIAQELARTYPNEVKATDKFHCSRPGLVGNDLRGPVTKFSTVLLATAGVGLLLACANLAGMLLARASGRQREIGIRLALGASKAQLLRQLFAESLLLSLGGGLLGLAMAYAACALFSSWHPVFVMPISTAIQPNVTVLLFSLAVALATTLLFGLAPALQAIRTDVVPSLKNEPSASHFRKWTLRDLLVAGQIALSVMLVISSVLVIRSLQHALSLNLGFNPNGAVSVSFDLGLQRYDSERSRRFAANLLGRVTNTAGLDAVGVVNNLPLRAGGLDSEFISRVDRPVPPPADRHVGLVYNISPGYLHAAGTQLLAGRDVTLADRQGTQPVALVNETAAHLLFGREDPLGRRFRLTRDPHDPGVQVVGVVETGKYLSLGEDREPAVFLPIAQSGTTWTTLVARSRLPAAAATELLKRAVLDLDPELTVFDAGSLNDQLAMPLFPARIVAVVLGLFGALAMVLAATGLFALMSYAVSRRTREIGIRLALGARAGQVILPVLRHTLLLCGLGILLGTASTLAAGRLLSAVLYGISPHDPATYGAALLLMLSVAVLACWQPVLRAIRIDPANTLRAD